MDITSWSDKAIRVLAAFIAKIERPAFIIMQAVISSVLIRVLSEFVFDFGKKFFGRQFSENATNPSIPAKIHNHIFPPAIETQLNDVLHALPILKSKIPVNTGILLSGIPGTGKTTFAEQLAADLKLPFKKIELSALLDKYYGETTKIFCSEMDSIVNYASKHQTPVVVLIDEADTLFTQRNAGSSEGSLTVARDSVNAFLARYYKDSKWAANLIVIMCTNFPEKIDAAIVRHGRLGHHIHLKYDDPETLGRLITYYLEKENFNLASLSNELKESWINYLQVKPERSTPAFIQGMIEGLKRQIMNISDCSASYQETLEHYHNGILGRAAFLATKESEPLDINTSHLEGLIATEESAITEAARNENVPATNPNPLPLLMSISNNIESLTNRLAPSAHR